MRKSGFVLFLVMLISMMSVIATTGTVKYTNTTKTVCDSAGVCSTAIYTNQAFAVEDGQWKSMDKLRSWEGTTYQCMVNSDGQHDAVCLDFNATTRKISLKQVDKYPEDVPVIVWHPNIAAMVVEEKPINDVPIDILPEKGGLKEGNINDNLAIQAEKASLVATRGLSKVDTDKIDVVSNDVYAFNDKVNEQVLTITAAPDDIIEIGQESTTIFITHSDALADLTIVDSTATTRYGFIEQWDLSAIPLGAEILAATQHSYIMNKYGSPNATLKISRVDNLWIESSTVATIRGLWINNTLTKSMSGNAVNTYFSFDVAAQLQDCYDDTGFTGSCAFRVEQVDFPITYISSIDDNNGLKLARPTSIGYIINDREGSYGSTDYNYLNLTYNISHCVYPAGDAGQYICEYGFIFKCVANDTDNYMMVNETLGYNGSINPICSGTCITNLAVDELDISSQICLGAYACSAPDAALNWYYGNSTVIPGHCEVYKCNASSDWEDYLSCPDSYTCVSTPAATYPEVCVGATTTTTLISTNTNNVITRGLSDLGGSIGLTSNILWLILMLIVGGGALYLTRGAGFNMMMAVLAGAELLMIILGAVMGMISVGVIILIVIAGAGALALFFHKMISGAGSSGG